MQLSTVRAKSEALKIRQAYEVARIRNKFEAAPGGQGAANACVTRESGAHAAASEASDSESQSDASGNAAFDEPVKVRRLSGMRYQSGAQHSHPPCWACPAL